MAVSPRWLALRDFPAQMNLVLTTRFPDAVRCNHRILSARAAPLRHNLDRHDKSDHKDTEVRPEAIQYGTERLD